jgi:DNA mismatch repair protein MutS2
MMQEDIQDILEEGLISLELPAVLEEVSSHCQSVGGRSRVLEIEPDVNIERISAGIQLVSEFVEMIRLDLPLGLTDLTPMDGLLLSLDVPTRILDAESIISVGGVIERSQIVKAALEALPQRFVELKQHAAAISLLDKLLDRIKNCFDEHGAVRSEAGPGLRNIRIRMRQVRKNIISRLEDTVRDRELAGIVQEDYVTIRNDRYVILLKPEFRGRLDGIIHDHSRSGASVYVEPFRVVELNNQMASLADEESFEIRRILESLTGEIRAYRDIISENYETLVLLDSFQARAFYAISTDSVIPELVDKGLKLMKARHPLLSGMSPEETVPMDVIHDPETNATIISGANMGGKTVALKIAGLFPLMARCSMLLPAAEGTELHLFNRVMADIGDDQDIRSHVSSFSGHMNKIKLILDSAGPGDLVLLDELGGATDPEEGAALAMAILDELIDRGTTVLATTHLTHLKAYALSRPDVRNVSVEFHPQTLKPTFRLLYDLPGESHSIATAERMGLPPGVIEAAKMYANTGSSGGTELVRRLRDQLAGVEGLRAQLQKKSETLEEELNDIKTRKDSILEEHRNEFRELFRKAGQEISEIYRTIKNGQLKSSPKAKELLDRIKNNVVDVMGSPLEKTIPYPDVGSRVRVTALGREGIVKSVEQGRAEVMVGKLTTRIDIQELELIGMGPEKMASKKSAVRVDIPLAEPRWEINVIGMRSDEAISRVEQALDQAILGGLASLRIIHGKGTGRLQKAIREYLEHAPLVRSFRSGDPMGGGQGVTLVDLVCE